MKNHLKKFLPTVLCLMLLTLFQLPVLAADGKININTANQQELTLLKRIGSKYATRIIKYREKNGDFKSPQDIVKVPGIGWKTFQVNKDVIIVAEEVEEKSATVAKTE